MHAMAYRLRLDIKDVIIRNIKRLNSITAIQISNAYLIKISDITFWNNSSPLIHLYHVNHVIFVGYSRISSNTGQGINIEFVKKLEVRNSTISLKNSTSERGMMTLYSVKDIQLSHSKLTFENNTCLQLPSNIWGAVLLVQETSLYLFNSILLFSHNSAPLSGGITLIKADITITNSSALFVHNESFNGGAMSLYQESKIFAKFKGCDPQYRKTKLFNYCH